MTIKPDPDRDQLDAVFFALASEPRRRILDVLKLEPGCNVNRVCAFLENDIGRFAVMKHLATLEAAGLVIKDSGFKRSSPSIGGCRTPVNRALAMVERPKTSLLGGVLAHRDQP